MATLSAACKTDGLALAIVSPRDVEVRNLSTWAGLLAHELGHTLGMNHDGENNNGGPCDEDHGLMASTVAGDWWTSCSQREFLAWYQTSGSCLKVSTLKIHFVGFQGFRYPDTWKSLTPTPRTPLLSIQQEPHFGFRYLNT